MVVGRRRVAAASVATAYGATYLRPPQHRSTTAPTGYPVSFDSSPIAEKLVCIRTADTSRGCWYPYFPRVLSLPPSLPTHPPPPPLPPLTLSLPLASSPSLSLSESTTPFQLSNRATRTPNAGPHHTTVHPLFRSVLSASIHPLLAFSFFYPDSSVSFSRINRLPRGLSRSYTLGCPTPELKQSISYCGLSRY